MSWTSPKTFVTGDILTAGEMNIHLRDNLLALAGSTGKVDASATVKGLQGDVILLRALGM